jgi:carboxylate-amine ligase
VSAFPLSGTPPWLLVWEEFEEYYKKLMTLGVIKSMKDFYWDIRPKPEYGTVELRICDTPLTVKKAAELAAFAQLLSYYLLENRRPLSKEIYLTYLMNRFRASRYGLNAIIIDPVNYKHIPLADDITRTCEELKPYINKFDSGEAIINIITAASTRDNGAHWLRKRYLDSNSLSDLVRDQTERWSTFID